MLWNVNAIVLVPFVLSLHPQMYHSPLQETLIVLPRLELLRQMLVAHSHPTNGTKHSSSMNVFASAVDIGNFRLPRTVYIFVWLLSVCMYVNWPPVQSVMPTTPLRQCWLLTGRGIVVVFVFFNLAINHSYYKYIKKKLYMITKLQVEHRDHNSSDTRIHFRPTMYIFRKKKIITVCGPLELKKSN